MAKSIKKAEAEAVQVANISPAVMKVLLAKMKASGKDTNTKQSGNFAKDSGHFEQSTGFTKFSIPGEKDISIQGSDFKINAETIKAIGRQ